MLLCPEVIRFIHHFLHDSTSYKKLTKMPFAALVHSFSELKRVFYTFVDISLDIFEGKKISNSKLIN